MVLTVYLQRHLHLVIALCAVTIFFAAEPEAADSAPEVALPLDGRIEDEGNVIEIEWPRASGRNFDPEIIQRRMLGDTGRSSWQTIATARRGTRYEDDDVEPGIAYEYRVSRYGSEQSQTGYWVSGTQLPADENRGTALLIVDETLAEDLTLYLERFEMDLTGDGWTVLRHTAPRHQRGPAVNLRSARSIQTWIREQFNADPATPHAVILIGNIPVVKSGRINPDGHTPRPLETDLFYADADGVWTDDGKGFLQHNVIPGDHIEMQIGRIDFASMNTDLGDELTLLKRYFDKNHNWRHGLQGDLRQAYGGHEMLFVETAGLGNIVGPDNLVTGGHHDAGTSQAWLFGVDFGSYSYNEYTTSASINAVFSINFGSGKLNFSNLNNTMKAMLGQQWYGIATGWGGRPSWQLHPMSLGRSIGYSHMRTVNNGSASKGGEFSLEYTPTGVYTWLNPVWANLLGDPTAHAFPLQSVRNFTAETVQQGVQLSWEAVEPKVQYRVYRASDRLGPYQPLNTSALLDETRFLDSSPTPDAWYMVRAYGLKEVYAGSFYTYSQGVFASADKDLPVAVDQTLAAVAGQELPIQLTAPGDSSMIFSFINNPDKGQLRQSGDEWVYYPDAAFAGAVSIPFNVFDGTASDEGLITINITQAVSAEQEPSDE